MKPINQSYRYLLILLLMLCGGARVLYGQADAQFSQYYEVPTYYNPGAVGSTEWLRMRFAAKAQWLGVTNAPLSFVAAGDMPFKVLNKNIGLGVVALEETLGLYNNLQISAQLAYKIKLLGGQLSIGYQLGMVSEGFKGSKVVLPDDDDYHQSTDEAIPQRDLAGTAFDMSAGLWYNRKNLYIGISCQHLLSPSVKFTSSNSSSSSGSSSEDTYEFEVGRMLYFIAGGNISIKNTLFDLMPSLMLKTDTRFFIGEANVRVRYNKFLIAGVGYRYPESITATIGAEYKNFYLGYSYDYSTSAIAKASYGSHELLLGYRMKLDLQEKNKNRHKSIRLM